MTRLIIFLLFIFWLTVVLIIKKINLEKESITFLISYPITVYLLLNLKGFIFYLKEKFFIYSIYKKQYNPHYLDYFDKELFLPRFFLIKKLKQYLYNKKQQISSSFLSNYFFSIELSIQREKHFYTLSPINQHSEYYKIFDLQLNMNSIKQFAKSQINEKEFQSLQESNVFTYLKLGNEPLDPEEVTRILYKISLLNPKIKAAIQSNYFNYFSNNYLKIKLLLTVSSPFKVNDFFNFIYLIDYRSLDKNSCLELKMEHNLISGSNCNTNYLEPFIYQSTNNRTYAYLPLNFLNLLKDNLNNNDFINDLSKFIEEKKSLYYQPTFVFELDKFLEFIKSLKLFNELNQTLTHNHSSKNKISKI